MKYLIGFIAGVIVATVGFNGIAKILDRGVSEIQNQTKELAK
jgi:hypothetical protein